MIIIYYSEKIHSLDFFCISRVENEEISIQITNANGPRVLFTGFPKGHAKKLQGVSTHTKKLEGARTC